MTSLYNLTNVHLFESPNPRTKRYGLDCSVYRASQILKTFPIEIRDSKLLKIFKHKIRYGISIRSPTFFFFLIVTFTLHLNVKNLQSPGNLYITWENKKWVKNLI